MSPIASRIKGVGMYVPEKVLTNDDLSKFMETSDEWIRQRTGIRQRHWVHDQGLATSDLAVKAVEDCLEKSGTTKEEIDLVVFATLSPDHEFPGTGVFLQAKAGIPGGVPVIDIRQQCTGFIYGMSIADNFIRSGQYKKVLVVGAEVHSKGLDRSTRGRDVTVLFGDGAGAVVMEAVQADKSKDSCLLSTHLHADGNFAKELWVEAPGIAYPEHRVHVEALERGEQYPKMNGKAVFLHASKRMPEAILEACKFNNIGIEEIDLFVLHQANLRINEMAAKVLKIPSEKVFNTIEKYANTTAATIPIGLAEAEKAGVLKKGMLVCSAAFGSGFTWGSALYRW